jgi:hypothetical protein
MSEYLKQLSVLLDSLQSTGLDQSKPSFHVNFTYTPDIAVHVLALLAKLSLLPAVRASLMSKSVAWYDTKTCGEGDPQGMRVSQIKFQNVP